MLQNLSQFKRNKINKLLIYRLAGLIFVAVFLLVVVAILFKAFYTAFIISKTTSAKSLPQIKDVQVQKAVELVEKWQRQESAIQDRKLLEIKKDRLLLGVLNGTKEENLATKAAKIITKAGYTNIEIEGSAQRTDYNTTVFKIKDELRIYALDIAQRLSLEKTQIIIENLQEGEKFDMLIIVGEDFKKKMKGGEE